MPRPGGLLLQVLVSFGGKKIQKLIMDKYRFLKYQALTKPQNFTSGFTLYI